MARNYYRLFQHWSYILILDLFLLSDRTVTTFLTTFLSNCLLQAPIFLLSRNHALEIQESCLLYNRTDQKLPEYIINFSSAGSSPPTTKQSSSLKTTSIGTFDYAHSRFRSRQRPSALYSLTRRHPPHPQPTHHPLRDQNLEPQYPTIRHTGALCRSGTFSTLAIAATTSPRSLPRPFSIKSTNLSFLLLLLLFLHPTAIRSPTYYTTIIPSLPPQTYIPSPPLSWPPSASPNALGSFTNPSFRSVALAMPLPVWQRKE